MLKIVKRLIFSILLFTMVAVGFFISNQGNKALAFDTEGACFWVDSGQIQCKFQTFASGALALLDDIKNKTLLSPSEIPILGSVAFQGKDYLDPTKWDEALLRAVSGGCVSLLGGSDCDDYYYAPEESANAGYPIFYSGGEQTDHAKYLHFVTNNPLYGYLSDSSSKIDKTPNTNDKNWIPIGDIKNADNVASNNECSLRNPGNCTVHGGGNYAKKALDTRSFLTTIRNIQALDSLKKKCESTAPLPFITCPIFEAISSAISSLIGGQGVTGEREGLLISFLTFSPLDANKNPEALQAIVGSIVSIANAFYIIIFLLLIFSSSLPLGLDNYTIKKTLPKFIGAVIMTQFAYVICGVVIDFFNLLGNLVPNILFALPLNSGIEGGGMSDLNQGLAIALSTPLFVSGAAFALAFGWIFIIIAVIIVFVAVLVAFVYMVLRYLILFILVLLAPIAFASWVLPGTEKFFKLWWKNFIRLNAMFPMITGLIAASIVVSQILLAVDKTNVAVKLVAVFIPVVALFAVPRTLKWTTDGMSAIAGGILGATAGKMGAGGRAVSKGTKMAAKKGYDYGKKETVAFGKRRAAEMGIGTEAWQRRQKTKDIEEGKSRAKERISNLDRNGLRTSSVTSMGGVAGNPRSSRAIGDARAHLDQLVQTGDAVGVANAMTSFRDSARASGQFANDQEIADFWNNNIVTGSNYGAVKSMSPTLVPATGADLDHINMASDPISRELKVATSGGDYSGVGSAKIAEIDKDILAAHVESGATAADLGFNQKALEDALTSDTVKWGNPKARDAAEKLLERSYQTNQFTRPASPPSGGGGPTASPGGGGPRPGPQGPTGGNTTTGSPGNPTINFGP